MTIPNRLIGQGKLNNDMQNVKLSVDTTDATYGSRALHRRMWRMYEARGRSLGIPVLEAAVQMGMRG